MLGLIMNMIPAAMISFLMYAIYMISKAMLGSDTGVFSTVFWMLEKTPARIAFDMFMLQTILAVSTFSYTLRSISNHVIQSFDILFFASVLLLALYQTFKVFAHPPVKELFL